MLDLQYPVIMGILNVTPDSFSDGGQFNELDKALSHARQMFNDGAQIIDIGGESTRPGAAPVSLQEEMDRVLPVIEKLKQRLEVCVSVDTSSAQLMLEAANLGADLINDVRALQRDGALEAAVKTGLPVCLMHMQGAPSTMQDSPEYGDIISEIKAFFNQRILACEQAGISKDKLLLDPGFGFGKTLEHNLTLINRLSDFADFAIPLVVGLSRKSSLGLILGDDQADRTSASVAGALISAQNGAAILRVHDVKQTADALAVWQAINTVSE